MEPGLVCVFHLPPTTHIREAGEQHGRVASAQIHAFLETTEIAELLSFATSPSGLPLLASLRSSASTFSPELAEEISGYHLNTHISVHPYQTITSDLSQLIPLRSRWWCRCG